MSSIYQTKNTCQRVVPSHGAFGRGPGTHFGLSEYDVGIAVRALVDVWRRNNEENVFGAPEGDTIDSRNLL